MYLIAGLGNPGEKYLKTRHNIGFLCIDQLQKDLEAPDLKEEPKFKAAISKTTFNDQSVILVKPLTFMNLSGEAIQKIASYFKIKPENIIVIYDDIDLPFEKIRIRANGGPGTHNGMKSTIQHIGSNFPRVRVGIESRGTLSPEQINLHDFVLSTFNKKETQSLTTIVKKASQATQSIVTQGTETAMNKFN